MKNTFFLLVTVLVTSLTSCKSQEKKSGNTTNGVPQPTSEPYVYKGVTDESCAVEVAFGSYGSGIDGKALEAVTKLADERKLKYTSKNIGREGETRICMPLTELKSKEKEEVIAQLKKIAKEGQLVSVSIR